MFTVQTPIVKRPAFWTFVLALVEFLSYYSLNDKIDPTLLLEVLTALIALIGVGAVGKLIYERLLKWKESHSDYKEVV
jgi:hypothetical protein